MLIMIFAAALAFAPPQDLPTDQLDRHADVVRQGILIDRTVRRDRSGSAQRNGAATREESRIEQTPEREAACANRERFAAQHGRNHPQVRRLYALCARAGY